MTALRPVLVLLPGGIYENFAPDTYVNLVREGVISHQPGVEAREAWEALTGDLHRHGEMYP